MPGQSEKAGLGPGISLREYLTFVSSSGAKLDVGWQSSVAPDEVTRGVTEWFGVADALGSRAAATLRSDGGASYVVTLGDGPTAAVHDTYDTLTSLSEPDTAWQVTATTGPLTLDLSGSALPTPDELRPWDALLGALDKLPADLPAAALSLHFLDRTVADLVLLAPDETTDETFTVAAYGPGVWPVVQPQLRAMAGLPEAWSYFASWAPVGTATSEHGFISLLSDQEPTDNGDESTRWSQAAAEYVEGL
jgi:hypothetical protein